MERLSRRGSTESISSRPPTKPLSNIGFDEDALSATTYSLLGRHGVVPPTAPNPIYKKLGVEAPGPSPALSAAVSAVEEVRSRRDFSPMPLTPISAAAADNNVLQGQDSLLHPCLSGVFEPVRPEEDGTICAGPTMDALPQFRGRGKRHHPLASRFRLKCRGLLPGPVPKKYVSRHRQGFGEKEKEVLSSDEDHLLSSTLLHFMPENPVIGSKSNSNNKKHIHRVPIQEEATTPHPSREGYEKLPTVFTSDNHSGQYYSGGAQVSQQQKLTELLGNKSSRTDNMFDPTAPIHRDKYPILIQTLFLVSIAVGLKLYIWAGPLQWHGFIELGEIGMVFTGLFFIQGMVFGGVSNDLKEAEKIPVEVVCSLEQLEDVFQYASKTVEMKGLRYSYAQELIVHFARTWREYLVLQDEKSYDQCMDLLRELIELATLWDANGAKCSGLTSAINSIRRPVTRASVISRTDVLPAARALLTFFVLTASTMLYLVTFKSAVVMVVVTTSILTVIWFTLRVIHSMENPFDIKPPKGLLRFMHGYMASVKLFPLNEYITKLERRWLIQIAREEEWRHSMLCHAAMDNHEANKPHEVPAEAAPLSDNRREKGKKSQRRKKNDDDNNGDRSVQCE